MLTKLTSKKVKIEDLRKLKEHIKKLTKLNITQLKIWSLKKAKNNLASIQISLKIKFIKTSNMITSNMLAKMIEKCF